MKVRVYKPEDYLAVEKLYKDSLTYGGQYDDARDSKDRLENLSSRKPDSILVAEDNGEIVGTVTLFEDGRSAWLYRFAVQLENEKEIAEFLWDKAKEILSNLGHTQVLVYSPSRDTRFETRYTELGFIKGGDFTAYWQDLDQEKL